jgi:phosphatidylglycerophosphate synthase
MRRQLPNQLTVARLVLAAAFFAVLNQYQYAGGDDPQTPLLAGALALFLVAALTDFLDGYLARKWRVVSLFGRIVDPVADKILIIGAFIYLAGPRFIIPPAMVGPPVGGSAGVEMASGVYPWMVVVILLRELGVTSIRAALESRGIDFSARGSGKMKMILQVFAVPIVILVVWIDPVEHEAARWVRDIVVWATVLATIISGLPYITGAMKAAKGEGDSHA